jgi:hypothetical protein
MSKKAKKAKSVGARRGRPRKEGARFPSGRLKPVNPKNELVIERRKELCDDITKASSPLDAALANGWISEADHRAATTYASLYRATMSGGPSVPTAVDVSTPTSVVDYRGVEFREMEPREVATIWDAAMSKPGAVVDGQEDLEKHARAVKALERWKDINDRMPKAVRDEMFRVCIDESWPQWINHRAIAKSKAAKIAALKREPTEAEKADIERFANSRWEASRDLLLEGCRVVRAAARQMRDRIEAVPVAPRPTPAYLVEAVAYVDLEGEPLLTIERRSRVRPARV